MLNTFMIIDDDISVVKMLSNLIKKNDLGRVVEELTDSDHAVDEILFYNPDILLIDYLLPTTDGLEIIKSVMEKNFSGKIIMISQVENQSMISNAYNSGVLFFINKPINSIEVINVIKTVSHSIMLENSLSLIKSALSTVNKADDTVVNETDSIQIILTDLGIISDSGSQDLIKIINTINEHRRIDALYQFNMRDIYYEVLINSEGSNSLINEKDIRSLEQRTRRIILKSLGNIAQIGLDDFYNPKFTEYSSLLFDMKNIKQEMKYLENSTENKGKINIKKFIKGIITKL